MQSRVCCTLSTRTWEWGQRRSELLWSWRRSVRSRCRKVIRISTGSRLLWLPWRASFSFSPCWLSFTFVACGRGEHISFVWNLSEAWHCSRPICSIDLAFWNKFLSGISKIKKTCVAITWLHLRLNQCTTSCRRASSMKFRWVQVIFFLDINVYLFLFPFRTFLFRNKMRRGYYSVFNVIK